ncbi:unnamed protein product, partial [Rotaria magnacalcarata]
MNDFRHHLGNALPENFQYPLSTVGKTILPILTYAQEL